MMEWWRDGWRVGPSRESFASVNIRSCGPASTSFYIMFAFIYLFTLCESIYKTPDQTVYTHTYTVARLVSCKIRRNFSLSFPGRINENKIFLYDGWICICRSFIYRGPTLLSLPLAHRFRNWMYIFICNKLPNSCSCCYYCRLRSSSKGKSIFGASLSLLSISLSSVNFWKREETFFSLLGRRFDVCWLIKRKQTLWRRELPTWKGRQTENERQKKNNDSESLFQDFSNAIRYRAHSLVSSFLSLSLSSLELLGWWAGQRRCSRGLFSRCRSLRQSRVSCKLAAHRSVLVSIFIAS